MYLNEERFEVEKRFREYLWTEYSFLKKEGLLFADDQKAIDKLKEYLPKDGFLRMSYDWYIKSDESRNTGGLEQLYEESR